MKLPTINPSQETKNIISFITSTFKKAGKTKAVVAVSGGVDSATTLMLTAKALKPNTIHPLILPSKTTHRDSIAHAKLAIKTAQITEANIHLIPIGSIIQKTWRIIKHYDQNTDVVGFDKFVQSANSLDEDSQFSPSSQTGPTARHQPQSHSHPQTTSSEGKKTVANRVDQSQTKHHPEINRLRLANLAARTRMMVIYDTSKQLDALVIGTENHSEHLLGYFTRYGDEASDLEPIKHLYKTQVYALAKHLHVPPEILTKAPSADLWPGQTDANELGFTYEQADPILYLHSQGKSETEIVKRLGKVVSGKTKSNSQLKALVRAVLTQVKSTAFKHQVPYQV